MEQRTPNSVDVTSFDWDWTRLRDAPKPVDRFQPVGILGGLNRDYFLKVLNHGRESSQPTFELRGGGTLGNSIRSTSATVSPSGQLRLYVDEWLETGVGGDGEKSTARDLLKAPNACAAVHRFASKHRMWLAPVQGGLILKFPSELGGDRIAPLPDYSLDEADRLFALFLLCNWRPRLAKCRWQHCGGRYFELTRWNRVYRRGPVCPECQRARSLKSAMRATSEARERAEEALYSLAAKRFKSKLLESTKWPWAPRLRAEIIDFLNGRIDATSSLQAAYPNGITAKWLSWTKNWNGIEEAAKGRSNAQS